MGVLMHLSPKGCWPVVVMLTKCRQRRYLKLQFTSVFHMGGAAAVEVCCVATTLRLNYRRLLFDFGGVSPATVYTLQLARVIESDCKLL